MKLPFSVRPLGLAVAALAALGTRPATGQIDFDAARVDTAPSCDWCAIADFDEDGRLDLLGALWHLHRGDGPGLFDVIALPPLPGFPAATADFDLDGHADVLALDPPNGTDVQFHWGDGTGRFSTGQFLNLVLTSREAVVGDFDGDGDPDAGLIADFALPDVTALAVIRNNGNRTFSAGGKFSCRRGATQATVVDLDLDGNLDLLAFNDDDPGCGPAIGLNVLLGDGTGSFAAPVAYETPCSRWGHAVGDVNADGVADVVVAANPSGLLVGDGAGGFAPPIDIGNPARAAAISDVNGDGNSDVVLATFDSSIVVLPGDGTSVLGTPIVSPIGSRPVSRAFVFDVDEDGPSDVVLAGSYLSVHRGDGSGRFQGSVILRPAGVLSPRDIASADFDGDGFPDLVVGNHGVVDPRGGGGADNVTILFGDGAGGFPVEINPVVGRIPNEVALADFDEDGLVDVASCQGLLLNNGDRSFSPGPAQNLFNDILSAGDVDGDGHADLVSFFSNRIRVLLGDGAGGLGAAIDSDPGLGFAPSMAVGDVDGDGRDDAVVGVSAAPSGAAVLLSDGTGSFSASIFTTDAVTEVHRSLAVGDMDLDGHADVVASCDNTTLLRIYFGDGTGGLPRTTARSAFFGLATDVAISDLDEDGGPDVAVNLTPHAVAVVRGDGRGSLREPVSFDCAQIASALLAADLDLDGHVDLAVTAVREISLLRNRTFDDPSRLCRRGNVNSSAGPIADVLRVNGSSGDSVLRRVRVGRFDPFEIFMAAPPSNESGPARFALYGWLTWPAPGDPVWPLPLGVGDLCFPPPRENPPRLKAIWNNLRHESFLGTPTLPSTPAPGVVFRKMNGLRRRVNFLLQGIVADAASPSGRAAVTNAIAVESR